ncbi:IS200/IS605 family transposase [Flavobacterium bizetiae]|uniref:IS200/IS605 family transposase n=1 Tax=Flavobacterium bizetiae TaxID=2704140 RepID=UPI0021E84824|nr:IS200/IS605 family transposase [Flavobacterium bizetiae]UTN04912.1 IS200/IS605 family transposase [Flavobacterium bizetiae]
MSQSLSKVYVHLTFSTKGRYPFIDDKIQERLWQYLGGICKGLECNPIQIGGHKDHVHILCLLSKKITQMKLVEEIKKQSSKWIKTIDENYIKFYWQDGYGIFSVNPSQLEIVTQYIKNQEEHHKKQTFKEELLAFLTKYHVTYDERFLWD